MSLFELVNKIREENNLEFSIEHETQKPILIKFQDKLHFTLTQESEIFTMEILHQDKRFLNNKNWGNFCYESEYGITILSDSSPKFDLGELFLLGRITNEITCQFPISELEGILIALYDWAKNCPVFKENIDPFQSANNLKGDDIDINEIIQDNEELGIMVTELQIENKKQRTQITKAKERLLQISKLFYPNFIGVKDLKKIGKELEEITKEL